MNTRQPIFSQLMTLIHPQHFDRCVRRFGGDYKVQHFTCWNQYLCMAYAQLTGRESLRDVVDCLCARPERLYHLGFRGAIRRSTLAYVNEQRDWRIYATLAQQLIVRARRLYADEPLAMDLDATVYALDSTTIDLCLSLFRWARFRRTKSAIKLHTLLDLRGPIPAFIHISDGKLHDVHALDQMPIEAGSFYVMDRGYLDFARLFVLHLLGAFFVIRAKRSLRYVRAHSLPVEEKAGVRSDQIIELAIAHSRQGYPERLRRIRFFDEETQRFFVYLTNNFALSALTIAQLYKSRWQVELFFKWIKQHLRIKRFMGTSVNAVKTQIWIAICVYSQVAILKKQLDLPQSLHKILRILDAHAFEKISLAELLRNSEPQDSDNADCNQLQLF
ncbi:MAG TPA: IS4 family transposase [Kiritimatiellia bacterium]|nr:IS4 family transposase [Kiritimatiellia bacterium]